MVLRTAFGDIRKAQRLWDVLRVRRPCFSLPFRSRSAAVPTPFRHLSFQRLLDTCRSNALLTLVVPTPSRHLSFQRPFDTSRQVLAAAAAVEGAGPQRAAGGSRRPTLVPISQFQAVLDQAGLSVRLVAPCYSSPGFRSLCNGRPSTQQPSQTECSFSLLERPHGWPVRNALLAG